MRDLQRAPMPDDASVRSGSGAMFDRIADRYDTLNRLLSLGVDQGWRRRTVDALCLTGGARVLDLATGTGDLAIAIARRQLDAQVVGLDPSAGMLAVGAEKLRRLGLEQRVELVEGDAQELPFESRSFDGVSIAFGIRNVPDRARALREMARVTRPGGRIAILELGEPEGSILGPLARFHVHRVVPTLGAWLSGANEYRYLERSIAAFPPAQEFADRMRKSDLEVLTVEPLTFGVCTLYVARPEVRS